MILYNVTVSVDESIHQDWLSWMKETHIPDVMATECFIENRMLRMLNEEEGGITYAIQYIAPSMEIYEKYQREFAPNLQLDVKQRYEGKFAAFRTVLEIVHETR